MLLFDWFFRRRDRRRAKAPVRLCLEQLESRTLPATFHWIGGTNLLWSEGKNWLEQVAPTGHGTEEDLLFKNDASVKSLVSQNNLTSATFRTITFNADPVLAKAGGFTITGNAFGIGTGNLTDSTPVAGHTNKIAVAPLSLDADLSIQATNANASLDLSGTPPT